MKGLFGDIAGLSTIDELTIYPFNRVELRLAAALTSTCTPGESGALQQAARSRGAAYAARFRHSAEISWRMPALYSLALADGRFTIDHFDTIWRRLDGHKGIREEIVDREARMALDEEPRVEEAHQERSHQKLGPIIGVTENGRCARIDQEVEREMIASLKLTREGEVFPVLSVHRVRENVDRAINQALIHLQRLRAQSHPGDGFPHV